MKHNDDILWKGVLEDLFEDFLHFFFPQADQLFDLEKGFEYLDKELEQLFPPEAGNYAPRYVDKLVKVFTISGSEEWILIHVEVQGYVDPDFAKRMFTYCYRILDKYDKPVSAFAIFTDASKNFHPKYYELDFLGNKIFYAFNTLKIIDQDDVALEASNNPFAMALLSAKVALSRAGQKDTQLLEQATDLAKRLLAKQMPKDKIRRVMTFLRYYLRFENQETLTKFEQQIRVLTEGSSTMGIEDLLLDRAKKEGIEEGIEKGIEKGERKKALDVAREMKNDGIPFAQIEKFTRLTKEEIEKL